MNEQKEHKPAILKKIEIAIGHLDSRFYSYEIDTLMQSGKIIEKSLKRDTEIAKRDELLERIKNKALDNAKTTLEQGHELCFERQRELLHALKEVEE